LQGQIRAGTWCCKVVDSCEVQFLTSSVQCVCVCDGGRGKKRSMGEELLSSDSKAIKMGNAELTRLWNLCPDNMAACLAERR